MTSVISSFLIPTSSRAFDKFPAAGPKRVPAPASIKIFLLPFLTKNALKFVSIDFLLFRVNNELISEEVVPEKVSSPNSVWPSFKINNSISPICFLTEYINHCSII